MNTKKLVTFLSLSLCLAMSACSKSTQQVDGDNKQEVSPTVQVTQEPTVTEQPTKQPTQEPTVEPTQAPVESSYQVEVITYAEEENRKMQYLKITDWALEDKMNEWNDLFYQEVESRSMELQEGDGFYWEYQVTEQTDDILSVKIECFCDYLTAAHPSCYAKAYTINMKTGDAMTLKDYADPATLANKLLSTQEYNLIAEDSVTLADVWDYQFYGITPTEEILTQSFSHFDMDYESYGDGECYGSSYLNDGNVCLIMDIPHVIGDYVIIEFK